MIKIAPSILSCDFSKLGQEIIDISASGADYIHIDVMDGHFVPNITLGPSIIRSIRNKTDKIFDVHLMIDNPNKYIDAFYKAGADIVTIHAEVFNSISFMLETINKIKSLGIKACVSLNPATPTSTIIPILNDLDMVLIMSVNPGFGGQSFISDVIHKIKEIRSLNPNIDIEVDGGINEKTAKICIENGANVLVAGNYIFAGDYKERIESLKMGNIR